MANKDSKISEQVLLPAVGESAAISLKPKTAALCYDRIWSTSDTVVPKAIRCWGGSPAELDGRGLAADWNMKTNRAPIAAMCGPEEKRLQLLRASTDYGLGLVLREIARSFCTEYGTPIVPIYDLSADRISGYREGERQVIVATLLNLRVVDEQHLTWEQVIYFRKDEENMQKYKRFLHWLDKDMVGKSRAFIEDDIALKLDDYQRSLKKHGIRTILGTIEEVLDGKYLLGASGVGGGFALAGQPVLGMLAAGLLIGGKVVVKLIQTKFDFEDVERGPNSEISWVYETKKLGK